MNKFRETKLTYLSAKTVKAPIIKECIAHLEYKLYKQIPAGDHTLFISEIQAAYADENLFDDEYDLERLNSFFILEATSSQRLAPKSLRPYSHAKHNRSQVVL